MQKTLFHLGARLEACAELVREGSVLADIGTDHAYLPIWLASGGKITGAFACDINEEPLCSASDNIRFYGLSDKIRTRMGDGLQAVSTEQVDDIVIAGMGGDNIAAILNEAPWVQNLRYRLILQPMTRSDRLRAYLFAHQFRIECEKYACESNRVYIVMQVSYSEKAFNYTAFDVYAGLADNRNEVCVKMLKMQAAILEDMAKGYAVRHAFGQEADALRVAAQLRRYADGASREEAIL